MNFWLRWVLGLCSCRLFSGCGKQGPLSSCCVWSSRCCGFSHCGAQALGHVVFSSCGAQLRWTSARGIFPDQGSNPCLLHWQVDSLPLSQQESPLTFFFFFFFLIFLRVEWTELGGEGCVLSVFSAEGQTLKPCFRFLSDSHCQNSPWPHSLGSSLRSQKSGCMSIFEELHHKHPSQAWHEVPLTGHKIKRTPYHLLT